LANNLDIVHHLRLKNLQHFEEWISPCFLV